MCLKIAMPHSIWGLHLGSLQAAPQGVYVAMNSKIFEYNKVIKNRDLGEFQAN